MSFNKYLSTFLFAVMLVPMLFSATVAGQFETPSWELGWDTDMDEPYVVDLDGNRWSIEDELLFYVDNTRMSQVSLVITVEISASGVAESDLPITAETDEEISIGANSNETFAVYLNSQTKDLVRSFDTSKRIQITITAEEQSTSGQQVSSKEIDGDIELPKIHSLIPEVASITKKIDAGTGMDHTLILKNEGNHQDAVLEANVEIRGCVHLSVVGLEELEGTIVKPTGVNGNTAYEAQIRLEASSSHPTRSCEVTISVVSEGDGKERSSTFEVSVEAVDLTDDTGDDNSGSDDGSSSGGSSEEIPGLSMLWLSFALIAAALRRQY